MSCEKNNISSSDEEMITITGMTVIELNDELKDELTNMENHLHDHGWMIVGNQLQKEFPLPNASVLIDGKELKTDKDGNVLFPTYASDIQLVINDHVQSLNRETNFTFVSEYKPMGSFAGCCGKHVHKSMNEEERCQDYNGMFGNGENDQEPAQALINFIGSDCDIAMGQGYCWNESFGEDTISCYANHGGKICSELI